LVRTLIKGNFAAQRHVLEADLSAIPAGVYFFRLQGRIRPNGAKFQESRILVKN
jgi:hypothetical protein